jgi:hypothetical protein
MGWRLFKNFEIFKTMYRAELSRWVECRGAGGEGGQGRQNVPGRSPGAQDGHQGLVFVFYRNSDKKLL